MEELKDILAKNLIAYRKANNLTQLDLAEKLNYSDKAVSKWERGESVPDIFVLKEIANLYQIPVDYLLTENEKNQVKRKDPKQIKKLSHLMIMLLSVGLVWLVAVCVFVGLFISGVTIPNVTTFQSWHCFVIAIPVSFIVCVVFSCIWFSWQYRFSSISALIWTIAVCLDVLLLSANFDKSYLFYIICIPLQILTIMWYIFRYVRKQKRKEEKLIQEQKDSQSEIESVTSSNSETTK
jgi:transcriptional regulator with XRE-family HTH domain